MIVKVKRCEFKTGERKDGTEYEGTSAVVLLNADLAAKVFIGSDVCDPDEIVPESLYDMWRDEKGFVLVFEKHVDKK